MKVRNLLLLLLFISAQTLGQSYRVTFRVEAHNLADSERVYVAGNQSALGNWAPDEVALERIGESYREKSFSFSAGTELRFKFTKGSWDQEALYEEGVRPEDFVLLVQRDTVFFVRIEMWRDDTTGMAPINSVTGLVEYIRALKGEGIRPRDVTVWLPPDYAADTTLRCPVLYMHDGQNLFNPALASFGRDWQLDETSDSLIRNGITVPYIIVGIYNTPARYAEYRDNDTGQKYMNWLVKDLKPYIDSRYRTLPDRENTATGGSSLGGLISLMLLWEYNDVFSKAMCMSPAFSIREIDYTQKISSTSAEKRNMLLYIDNGGIDLESLLQPGIDKTMALLVQLGYEKEKDFYWRHFPEAEHNEPAWAKRAHIPLKLFFGK